MPTLLHLAASPRGALSFSNSAARSTIARLRDSIPNLTIVERQLGQTPLPPVDQHLVAASLMPAAQRGAAELAALALSEQLIVELEVASIVLISTPMYNFTVPAALKNWLDYVVRPHRTFALSAAGKAGMLADLPVRVLMASGGPVHPLHDFATPYLRHVFQTIGLADFEAIHLEQMLRGEDAVARSQQQLTRWQVGFVEQMQVRLRV
ncbi:NAD(P)H-dependent oxidoreductase [Oxalobacteraceae bacterium]|nr:NAD(P)H-dependent oxidoreductase [Oxalobacteraceae bacterium]